MNDPDDSVQPMLVPDHRLVRRIGRGSYGEVWLAVSLTGQTRAVKFIHRRHFADDKPYEREFRGLLAYEPLSRRHPNLVQILHVGRSGDDEYYFYVMELADAMPGVRADVSAARTQTRPDSVSPLSPPEPDTARLLRYQPWTLRAELQQAGRIPPARAAQICAALSRALSALHSQGLVHRDVKPSNVIFVDGVPRLADLGLVTGVDATAEQLGTEGYQPPEGSGSPAGDIYSLGKLLYEISSGQDRMRFPEAPPDFAAWPDRVAVLALDPIIHTACDCDPRRRFASAATMAEALESGRMPVSRRAVMRAAAAGGMLTASGAFWLFQRRREVPADAPEAHDEAGFVPLFDDHSFAGWYIEKGGAVISAAQIPASGIWARQDAEVRRLAVGGNLVKSGQLPRSFELRFDWKVSACGDTRVNYGNIRIIEYRCLDDAGNGEAARRPEDRAGALLASDRAGVSMGSKGPALSAVRSAEEWNSGRIVCTTARVEHWLNGQRTAVVDLTTNDKLPAALRADLDKGPRLRLLNRGSARGACFRNVRLRNLPPA